MTSALTQQGNWQWFDDVTPDSSMSQLANENVAPTLTTTQSQDGIIRLRISLNETGGKADSLGAISLDYSYDNTNWTDIEDNPPSRTNEHFRFANGAATDGNTISTRLLTGTTEDGTYHENDAGTESVTANGELEIDLAIQCHWPPPGETVYFRVTEGGTVITLDSGATVITLTTATAANRGNAITQYGAEDTGAAHRGFRYSGWEKVWYDGTRWWFFYVDFGDPTNLSYHYWNGPGNDWSSKSTISLPCGLNGYNLYQGALDLAFKTISGTPVVWAAYVDADSSGSTVYFRRGEISGTSITWDSETNVSQSSSDNTIQIAIDDGNYIWIAGSTGTEIFTRRSTNADTGTSWTDAWQSAQNTTGAEEIGSREPIYLIGLASDKALVIWINTGNTDLDWAYVTDASGYSSIGQVNTTTDCNDDNTGITRAGGYVYLVTTDTVSSSGGNWHGRVYTESTDTWSTMTAPSTTGPAGSNDGIAVASDGDDIYVFQTGSVGSLGGRTVVYKKYAGPGASGTWDSSFTTISPATDRGNGDYVSAPRASGGNTLLVLHHFNHDLLAHSEHTIEYHYETLAVIEALSGSTAGVSTAAGSVDVDTQLSGQTDAVSTASGAVAVDTQISGQTDAVSAATGALAVDTQIAGQTDAVSTATGAITVSSIVSLSASSDAVSTATGTMIVDTQLAGQSDGVSSASGAIAVDTQLSGQSDGVSTATGALDVIGAVDLSGSSDAVSTVTGAVGIDTQVSGSTDATSAVSGTLAIDTQISGQTDAVSTATGTLAVTSTVLLSGSSDAVSTATGAIIVDTQLSGSSDGVSTAGGAIIIDTQLVGQTDAVSTATGAVIVDTQLSGVSAGVAALTGVLDVSGETIPATLDLEGTVVTIVTLSAAPVTIVTLSGVPVTTTDLSGVPVTTTDLSAAPVTVLTLEGTQ